MIIVDSSVWVDYFNGEGTPEVNYLDSVLAIQPVAIGDLILAEVLQGFRRERDYVVAKDLLLELTIFAMLGQERAIRVAENYRSLRRRGITIRKTSDVIIATFCIEAGIALLFSDNDFLPFVRQLGLVPALPST